MFDYYNEIVPFCMFVYQATKKLRSMGIDSMIAGVSARSVEAHKQEFMEAGLDHYLEKPLTTAKLTSIINKIIRL